MKILFVFLFTVTYSYAQEFIPKSDTIVHFKDGSEYRYKVYPHAIYMTGYVKDAVNGPSKSYYKNGKLWAEQTFLNGRLEGKAISYTPKGDTAQVEEWHENKLRSRIIYYNSTYNDPQLYYFVSKKGFPLLLNNVQAKLDQTTPDSLIEEGLGYTYMWLKGEKKLIAGEEAPKFIMITTGDKPGVYEVKGDKQTFSRPFTEGEKKLFMKAPAKK